MSKDPVRGRGAASNPAIRFEKAHYERNDDCDAPTPLEPGETEPSPRTQFFSDHSRTVLAQNNSPDVGFTFSINPYRGCEHGCAYCYARPTHEYLGLSAGIDFETRIFVKENAPALLREALMKPSWKPEVISISGVTDCYQPAERRFRLTRQCLEVLREFRNPCTVITKNHGVTRDIDVLSELASFKAAAVFVSVTTLDDELCEVLEPRTSRPRFRLKAIEELTRAGIPVGVMVAPCIPGLTDHEMPAILKAAAEAGARHAGYVPLRLPLTVLPIFLEWLENHRPERKEKVLSHIRQMRGGKLNNSEFGNRMRGEGVFADQMKQIFDLYTRRHGLNHEELDLSADSFQRPGEQMKLF